MTQNKGYFISVLFSLQLQLQMHRSHLQFCDFTDADRTLPSDDYLIMKKLDWY